MKIASVVARRDGADGVGDHAAGLAQALEDAGFAAPLVRIPWGATSARAALAQLHADLAAAAPDRVILHYSHLAWSNRGWPFGLLRVLVTCRRHAPVVLWVHDPDRSGIATWRDRLHSSAKRLGLRAAARRSHRTIVATDPELVYWADGIADRLVLIPSTGPVARTTSRPPGDRFTVSVFGLNVGSGAPESVPLVALVEALVARLGRDTQRVRVRLLGEGNTAPTQALHASLEAAGAEVDRPGYLDADALGERLAASHAFVMTRAGLSTRNSSTACALACGLPVVGYEGSETGAVLRAAAVVVPRPPGAAVPVDAMADALAAIAGDDAHRRELSARSHHAYDAHYAWPLVAKRVVSLL